MLLTFVRNVADVLVDVEIAVLASFAMLHFQLNITYFEGSK